MITSLRENKSRKILCLWHQLAICNKRKRRQIRNDLQLVKSEVQQIQQQLQELRCQQLNLYEDMATMMTILMNTESLKREAVWYFMLHLKINLDVLSQMKTKNNPQLEMNVAENDLRNYGIYRTSLMTNRSNI